MENLAQGQIDHYERAEARRQDFEQQVVYKVLRHAGKIHLLRQLKDELAAESGSRRLTLDWLARRYPRFPLRLGAALPNEGSLMLVDVFQRYTKTHFFQLYREWREAQGLDDHRERVGIVLHTKRITMVLHNDIKHAGSAWRIVCPVGEPPVTFVLERLASLLDAIGTDWAGESPPGTGKDHAREHR